MNQDRELGNQRLSKNMNIYLSTTNNYLDLLDELDILRIIKKLKIIKKSASLSNCK
jgi:hypothetical protein